jgi:hypothetical protein
MNVVKATWKNGRVVLDHPAGWPEGRRLVVAEESSAGIAFLTEDEQRDDPESVRRWIDDLRAIPPLPMTPEQEAGMLACRQKAKEFNLEAIRKQKEEGIP